MRWTIEYDDDNACDVTVADDYEADRLFRNVIERAGLRAWSDSPNDREPTIVVVTMDDGLPEMGIVADDDVREEDGRTIWAVLFPALGYVQEYYADECLVIDDGRRAELMRGLEEYRARGLR